MSFVAAAALAPIVTGYIGGQQAKGAQNDANNQLNEILAMYNNLATPDVEQMRLNLQQYQDLGGYAPQQQVAEQLGATDALQNVQTDPRLKQQQQQSLEMLNQIAGGGFTPDQQVAMDTERRRNEADLTSRLKTMQQSQQERGMGNADFAMAQQVAEAQSSANRQAQDNAAMRASAFKNGLDAITQGGALAGQMESADYGRQANLAQSLNQRENTNMQQRANVGQNNVNAFNQALANKATNSQNIANQNTALGNTQQQYNKELAQQDYENKLKKLQGVSGAKQGIAAQRSSDAAATRQQWAGAGAGLTSIAGGLNKKV